MIMTTITNICITLNITLLKSGEAIAAPAHPIPAPMLLEVTAGYRRLPEVNACYRRLLQVTRGYQRLLQVTVGYQRLLQVTVGYCRLQEVTEVTGGYSRLS